MLLLLHIGIALGSIVFTTYLYFQPSVGKFRVSYGLVGATIASGTALVIRAHSPLLSSCITGLTYLGIVSIGIIAAHYKLAKQEN